MIRQLYTMGENGSSPPIPVNSVQEAREANVEGKGIHWAVNLFDGPRKPENCTKILSWCFEFDDIPKEYQWEIIFNSLYPSLVIESKRGYHVYYDAREADVESYTEIQSRIIYHFGSDPAIKGVNRLLRAPGYFHVKDPDDPFFVKEVWKADITYTPSLMLYWFNPVPKVEDPEHIPVGLNTKGTLFQKIESANQMELLKRLSGTPAVFGQTYNFKSVGRGFYNIFVDGKGTSCFIDSQGRIGSLAKGGPLIWQWLRWFGYSHKEVYSILRNYIPELF